MVLLLIFLFEYFAQAAFFTGFVLVDNLKKSLHFKKAVVGFRILWLHF